MKGNIAEEVAKLKQQEGKDILVAGSGELVHTLMQHDLILATALSAHSQSLRS